jgi:hypothetical protein
MLEAGYPGIYIHHLIVVRRKAVSCNRKKVSNAPLPLTIMLLAGVLGRAVDAGSWRYRHFLIGSYANFLDSLHLQLRLHINFHQLNILIKLSMFLDLLFLVKVKKKFSDSPWDIFDFVHLHYKNTKPEIDF